VLEYEYEDDDAHSAPPIVRSANPSGADIFVAIVLSPIGILLGLVQGFRGKQSGWMLVVIATTAFFVKGLIALLFFQHWKPTVLW
jgi:hypothetical protein